MNEQQELSDIREETSENTRPTKANTSGLKRVNVSNASLGAKREAYAQPKPQRTQYRLEDFDRYIEDAINPHTQDVHKWRAERQGALEQFRNSIVQGVGGHIIGGGIETAGYMLELLNSDSYVRSGENNFGNAISEFGKRIKQNLEEDFPIYTMEEGGFNPADSGWWFQNAASIASSLGLAL